MYTINLTTPELSDIKFTKIKYADSQVSIKFDEASLGNVDESIPIFIITRFNTYEDLFYLLALTDVLKFKGKKKITVAFTCFLGQRSDRRFTPFQSFDLKIITDIINAQEYDSVFVNEPHSDVLPALLDSKVMPIEVFFSFVQNTLNDKKEENIVLVSPDAGAYKKVATLAEKFKVSHVAAIKHRAADGEPKVVVMGNVVGKTCVIYDDYCDGGRTFISLGKQLKQQGANKVILAAAHGLYSYGIEPLKEFIDYVISTNSISDIGVMSDGYSTHDYTNYVIQQNLFGK